MNKKECADIDIGNQIDNSWNKDTSLALKLGKFGMAVKIRGRDKKQIKIKYLKEVISRKDVRHNRQITVIVYCFLLHKLLTETDGIVTEVKLCHDINPHKNFYRFLQIISKYYNIDYIGHKIKIRFKEDKDGNSKAHNLANKVYRGRKNKRYNIYMINKNDMQDIFKIIEKIMNSKDGS